MLGMAALSGCSVTSMAENGGKAALSNSFRPLPGWRYTNTDARHTDYPGAQEWAKHLSQLVKSEFAEDNPLPNGHVLPAGRAADLFREGKSAAANGRLTATWFGHATFFLQSGDVQILTDPFLSRKTGPFGLGLGRMVPVLPDPDLLEDLDAVIISHSDYDHLDLPSLWRLSRRFPQAVLIVPDGTMPVVATSGFRNVIELGHHESFTAQGLKVTAVPAVHGTRRVPFPINFSHWNGYRISLGGHEIYFSGDTGAGGFSKELRKRTGKSDIAIVPAGAWKPRDFEKPFHVNPQEAMELARDSGAATAIAMHWGTLPLSEDSNLEQRGDFLEAAHAAGVSPVIMGIGETRVVK